MKIFLSVDVSGFVNVVELSSGGDGRTKEISERGSTYLCSRTSGCSAPSAQRVSGVRLEYALRFQAAAWKGPIISAQDTARKRYP